MKNSVYLKGITSLRFFLALSVLLTHCNQNLKSTGIYWFENHPVLYKGRFAVHCFFMLSGFLLTYLAFSEYKTIGFVDFKRFFVRRILRIFPLYYLSVFLGYLTLGYLFPYFMGENYFNFEISEGIFYQIFMLPNFAYTLYNENLGALTSLWSIGVEEQFYLFFPFICFICFKNKFTILRLSLLLIMYYLVYTYFYNILYFDSEEYRHISSFLYTLKFQYMLLGGVFALLYYHYNSFINKISSFYFINYLVYAMVLLLFISDYFEFHDVLSSLLFCVFITVLINPFNSTKVFDHPVFEYLGKIAFGIYIFHPFVSYPLRYLMVNNNLFSSTIQTFPFLYYLIELFITILIASISYIYYERRFLKLKSRFSY